MSTTKQPGIQTFTHRGFTFRTSCAEPAWVLCAAGSVITVDRVKATWRVRYNGRCRANLRGFKRRDSALDRALLVKQELNAEEEKCARLQVEILEKLRRRLDCAAAIIRMEHEI